MLVTKERVGQRANHESRKKYVCQKMLKVELESTSHEKVQGPEMNSPPSLNTRHLEDTPSLPSQVHIHLGFVLYKLNTLTTRSLSILVCPSEVASAVQLVGHS